MNIKPLLPIAILLALSTGAKAQKAQDFKPALDSMQVLLRERTRVASQVKATKVINRDGTLDFHFNSAFGDYPWRAADLRWFKETLKTLLPDPWAGSKIGELYVGKNKIGQYIMPEAGSNGNPPSALFRTRDRRDQDRFITKAGEREYEKGMSGRVVALWQSHGKYYEEKTQRWEWQRAPLFQTVEDMYTQSYVLPFLIPMLENAGAYVMTPRERDPQPNEIIADNDPSFTAGRGEGVRLVGNYSESGTWFDAGTGFADFKAYYVDRENPFLAGTARQAVCSEDGDMGVSEAVWTPDIPERGEYSVYISYKSLPNSSDRARYRVRHLGGESEFLVNQKMGGGTWIYLGTFEFDKGTEGFVTLDNTVPEGHKVPRNTVVTADAVRFGGGMGKIARGQADQDRSEFTVSGMPSFAEGAYYWMQWAGADTTLLNLHEGDYTADYGERGAWVGWMSGGSRTNPKEEGLGIPVDLSFAFHSDAGTFPDDSIVGTLSIYTLLCENDDKLPNGESRWQGRMLADFTQTQIVDDVRADFYPNWTRRMLWDRSYSESRTTTVPGMLLELLSHQNFGDMKLGLDPSFRFTVSRAIYKGMLKYLSARYGCPYAVQPLPVSSFSTDFVGKPVPGQESKVRLSWAPTDDPHEPTAAPGGYILQTRIGDGAFDNGVAIDVREEGGRCFHEVTVQPGKIFSFRIIAFNEGGRGFPSEVLSVGVPANGGGKSALVVNNFTRVSPPAWFDTPDYAGFLNGLDSGVPYMREINFIGDQYQFRRELPWLDDDSPGFGASFTDEAGKVVPGNTFDFTAIHGKALIAAGYSYHSASSEAFANGFTLKGDDSAVDLICGKQVTTPIGNGALGCRFQVFPDKMKAAIKEFTSGGGNVIVSGSNIGTDVWDKVYPVVADSTYSATTKEFVETVLGYKWMTNHATRGGSVHPMRNSSLPLKGKIGEAGFWNERNPFIYNVETPDGIVPASDSATGFIRYSDSEVTAGVCFDSGTYKAVSLGFPIEVMKNQEDINVLLAEILSYLEKK
ncbi:MAG: xanthan lyase [Bacteroidales bacterium]|nr:xanthan lyase [Bacteroidales bacterium]